MPTPPDDILLNKAAIIERCIRRVGEEVRACPLYDDFSHVDALTLNIERACMAGFRNIAVHQYEELDMDVLRWVVETGHRDWIKLGEALGVSIRP